MRRYFADLIIALLQDHLAAAALVPALGGAPGAPAALPEPMLPGNHEANAGLVCLHDESLRAAAVPGNASARPSHARAVDPQLYSKGVSRDWRRHQVRKERCMRPSYTCPVGQCVYSRLLQ